MTEVKGQGHGGYMLEHGPRGDIMFGHYIGLREDLHLWMFACTLGQIYLSFIGMHR